VLVFGGARESLTRVRLTQSPELVTVRTCSQPRGVRLTRHQSLTRVRPARRQTIIIIRKWGQTKTE